MPNKITGLNTEFKANIPLLDCTTTEDSVLVSSKDAVNSILTSCLASQVIGTAVFHSVARVFANAMVKNEGTRQEIMDSFYDLLVANMNKADLETFTKNKKGEYAFRSDATTKNPWKYATVIAKAFSVGVPYADIFENEEFKTAKGHHTLPTKPFIEKLTKAKLATEEPAEESTDGKPKTELEKLLGMSKGYLKALKNALDELDDSDELPEIEKKARNMLRSIGQKSMQIGLYGE